MSRINQLKFSKGNAKLGKHVHTFSLPAGYTCTGAKQCLSMAVLGANGKRTIKDGEHTDFRCFWASIEVQYAATFAAMHYNWELLKQAKTVARMADLIGLSIPTRAEIIRIHVGGDYYRQAYFDAWLCVAREYPDRLFYGYTKSLRYWVARLGSIPENLVLTASYGGKFDRLIGEHDLRSARVVFTEREAKRLHLPIDHDDSHAMRADGRSFALLLHGTQPPQSDASKALVQLRKQGIGGYTRGKAKVA